MSPLSSADTAFADPEDRQSYFDEALSTARILAGNLAYLVRLHGEAGRDGLVDAPAQALFQSLQVQADRVVNFLEECR